MESKEFVTVLLSCLETFPERSPQHKPMRRTVSTRLHVNVDSYILRKQRGQSRKKKAETTRSGIAEYVWSNHNKILLEEAMVFQNEEHWFGRKFKEAAYAKQSAFRHPRVDINNTWRSLLTKKWQLTWLKRNVTSRLVLCGFVKPIDLSLHLLTWWRL